MTHQQQLAEIIQREAAKELIPFLLELTEDERRALHKAARTAFKDPAMGNRARGVAHLAFFATSTPKEVAKDRHHQRFGRRHANAAYHPDDLMGFVCAELVEKVRPDLAKPLIEMLFKGNEEYYFGWTLAFDLYLRGVADPTSHAKFHRGLYENLCNPFLSLDRDRTTDTVAVSFVRMFHDVTLPWIFALFQLPDFEGRSSRDHQTWVQRFFELVKADLVEPNQLVEICERGLRGAEKPRSAKFFADLMDALDADFPLETLVELCASTNPNTVKWSIKRIGQRLKEEAFPVAAVRDALAIAANHESPAVVKAARKMNDRVDKQHK